jgi:hypothetical protein
VNDPEDVKLAFTNAPPFKGLISPFRLREAHLGVKENLR